MKINDVKELIERFNEGTELSNVFNFVESDGYLIREDDNVIMYDPFDEEILFDGSISDFVKEHNLEEDQDETTEDLLEFLK